MFATGTVGKVVNSTNDVEDRSSERRHDEQENHHRDGSKLIFVFKGGSEKSIATPCLEDVFRFVKSRRFTPGDSFTFANFATHGRPRSMRVIGLAKPTTPEPSFTDGSLSTA